MAGPSFTHKIEQLNRKFMLKIHLECIITYAIHGKDDKMREDLVVNDQYKTSVYIKIMMVILVKH